MIRWVGVERKREGVWRVRGGHERDEWMDGMERNGMCSMIPR